MSDHDQLEGLLIGGRAGVGKTTVGWEVSAQLRAAQIAHALVEGDNLDQVHPAPPDDPARTKITRPLCRCARHGHPSSARPCRQLRCCPFRDRIRNTHHIQPNRSVWFE